MTDGGSSTPNFCKRNRGQCSKLDSHKGRCSSEKPFKAFWKTSPVYNLNKRKRNINFEEKKDEKELKEKAARLETVEQELDVRESDMNASQLNFGKHISNLIKIIVFNKEISKKSVVVYENST